MDFFQAQDAARARTRTLVLLFVAAVAAIIAAVYLVVHIATLGSQPFNPALLLAIALGVTALVGSGSTIRTLQLRQGGGKVATLLGGRRIYPNTTDEAEKRFVNVVEEMAIASGTPVPAMYVLDHESGINAFAAGYALDDAAVAVTRGALDNLNREELQGVMAHEFSHILNGDMRLNIRLMGLLYGILLLAVIGRGLLRGGTYGRRRKGGDGRLALVALGLMIIGYIGVFFGRLIQAAVSRQREYLADAAAVQFTRNPNGLAGALKKIGGLLTSRIQNHHAEEASHFFFASGFGSAAASMFATHPPLTDRIRRLDASFTGELAAAAAAGAQSSGLQSVAGVSPAAAGASLLASIGAPQPEHVVYARRLLASLPPQVHAAAHDANDVVGLLFALLLHDADGHGTAQLHALQAHGGEPLVERTRSLARDTAGLGSAARLPLLELARPTLAALGQPTLQRVRATALTLIDADERIDPFESGLLQLLDRLLHASGERANVAHTSAIRTHAIDQLREECEIVLSALAWSGTADDEDAAAAFAAAAGNLPRLPGLQLRPRAALSTKLLSEALGRLRTAAPAIRRAVLEATTHAVAHDGRVHALEAELLRAVAESIDCPIPPLTNTATIATSKT